MGKYTVLVLGVILAFLVFKNVFASRDIEPKAAKDLIKDKGAVVIDVRTVGEYQDGHLKNSHNIPVGDLSNQLDKISGLTKQNKDQEIVVYCRSGKRATAAKEILNKNGYKNVHNLGYITDWPDQSEVVR